MDKTYLMSPNPIEMKDCPDLDLLHREWINRLGHDFCLYSRPTPVLHRLFYIRLRGDSRLYSLQISFVTQEIADFDADVDLMTKELDSTMKRILRDHGIPYEEVEGRN